MILSKSRDFWFALIPVVGPDAAEFFHINGAVFCRLQLPLNLSQQFSHPRTSPISSKGYLYSEKCRGTGCMLVPETSTA